jgi:GT2 family glycosyltransferase
MLSIVIINYNTFEMTCRCIESIIQYTTTIPYEIILVDNASTECDADLFKNRFPSIKLVKNPENNGFSKGNNLGIKQANGDVILLLNSDTYFEGSNIDDIGTAYKTLKNLSSIRVGVLSVPQLFPDGKFQHNARRFKTIWWELLDLFRFIPYLLPKYRREQLMLGKYFDGKGNVNCDWVSGAFFMFLRKIVDELPGQKLNDDFFMYGEDCQWCYDIAKLGYAIRFYAVPRVYHINRGSMNIKNEMKTLRTIMNRELELYIRRGNPNWKVLIFKIIYFSKEEFRIAVRKILSAFGIKAFR